MDVVSEIAKDAGARFKRIRSTAMSLNSKEFLEEILYKHFTKNNDKRRFLLIFNRIIQDELDKHRQKCSYTKANMPCQFDRGTNAMLFAIEQVIDTIPETIQIPDSFSSQEQIFIANKLDDIFEKLKKMDEVNNASFEALYLELEELKSLMNIGKKNWSQLVKGKIVDMVAGSAFDASIGKLIIESINETISHSSIGIS